jgi:predicted MPP superfamily phosphohydrolase
MYPFSFLLSYKKNDTIFIYKGKMMKLLILQLSDIHFKENNNTLEMKKDKLVASVRNITNGINNLFITITGDIANTGAKKEFEIANSFFTYLSEELNKYNPGLQVYFITAPGNHDCDFSENDSIRELVIESINNTSLSIKKVDEKHIKTCTVPQINYFNFAQKIESQDHLCKSISSDLFKRYEFELEGHKIGFNSYNFSWLSNIHEKQSQLYYPCHFFKQELLKNTQECDINISMYHHPMHWLNHSNIKDVRDLINTTSNIVLSGHEHTKDEHIIYNMQTKSTQYYSSAALQTNNRDESQFKIIKLELNSRERTLYDGIWNQNDQDYEVNISDQEKIDLENCLSLFEMDEEYYNKINSIAQISHNRKKDLTLKDVFIFQDLKVLVQDDSDIEKKSIYLTNYEEINKTLIIGDETTGKTSLAHMLQMIHKENGKVPIYLSGKEIKPKDYEIDRFQTLIEKKFIKQYSKEDLGSYRKADKDSTLLILDDFNLITLNNNYKKQLLNSISEIFNSVVIFSHEDMELEVFNEPDLSDGFVEYDIYKINPFGHILRDQLIKKWIQIGQEETLSKEALHNELKEKASLLTNTLGNNIISSYPIYLLTLLMAIDGNKTDSLSKSSYGHYYSFLIGESLSRSQIARDDFNLYFTYLSHLAYECFLKDNNRISDTDFLAFHDGYRKQKMITLHFENFKDKLLNSKMLVEEHGEYKFTQDYLYYFFVAMYLSDNIDKSHVQGQIKDLVEDLHVLKNSNIIMFLVYHSNSRLIISLLLSRSKSLFEDIDEFEFSDKELIKINGAISKTLPNKQQRTIVIEDATPEETREKYLIEKEKEDKLTKETEALEEDDIFTKMNLSFKLTTILGEIAKKYYGELDGDVKIKLIREAYSINLRAVNIFISNFEEHHELIQKTIEEHIEKKGYATSIDIGLTSKKMIFNLLSQLTEGFILKVAKSVASKDLEQIYKNIFNQEKDKISIEIIDLAIELDFPKRLNQNAPNLYKKLEKNYLAQDTVRRLVAEHIYMYHVDHRVKDSVMDQMQMEKGNVNKLKDKQQLPFDE